jgi:hypothetical protein
MLPYVAYWHCEAWISLVGLDIDISGTALDLVGTARELGVSDGLFEVRSVHWQLVHSQAGRSCPGRIGGGDGLVHVSRLTFLVMRPHSRKI